MKGGVVLHKQSVKLNQAVLTPRTKGTNLLGWHIYPIRMPSRVANVVTVHDHLLTQ